MVININQKKISIGDKYQIFVSEQQTHTAATKLFKLLPEIHLFENGNEQPKYIIKKNWSFFYLSYNLIKSNHQVLEFRTKSYWRNHYHCQVGYDAYDIYGHRGRKYSVYKNDQQVAWWDKDAVSWFNGDNYRIIADKDCDMELIVSFCLIIDNSFSNDNDNAMFNFDLGSIGPQAKKFNPQWQPKY